MLSLAQALAALPDTADGIAARLAELGIRGAAGDSCFCAIAVYLASTGLSGPSVGNLAIDAYRDDETFEQVETPRNVAAFLERFDRGEYPALLLEVADV